MITPTDGGEKVFVEHQSDIISISDHGGFKKSLSAGENVEYEIVVGSDGKNKASKVNRYGEFPKERGNKASNVTGHGCFKF